ncbi:DUF5681 domain-containing protein [Bacteroidia bacterium]|nr:DUF5681 domain-containing protein [Bacteroidia bacterium]
MNPPTDHLPKWKKGQPSPNPYGRPPKFITTLKRRGYHAGDINTVILTILSLPEQKVSEIASNEEYTILERIIAKALINSLRKGNLYAMESLLNRSVGMPKQQSDIQVEEKKIDVTLNL